MSSASWLLSLTLTVLLHQHCHAVKDGGDEVKYKVSNGSYILESNKEWRSMLSEEPYIMLYIYIYWCEHCKTFAPHWDKLARKINAKDSAYRTKAFKFDINEVDAPYKEWNIRNLPTILYIRDGQRKTMYVDHENQDNIADDLLNFMLDNERDMLVKTTVESFEKAFERIEAFDDIKFQAQALGILKNFIQFVSVNKYVYYILLL